ncbi:MAG: recombination regulator RecX [Chloroflexi bacterium]|nr:recombination regulator RecX [Chloroflexota bacterium]
MADSMAERRARQLERRERRAAITDPAIVMAAGAAVLAIRARTTHELRTRLMTLGYPAELVDAAIERLGTLGYLDDEAYARAWGASRDRARPRGAMALRRELLRKGIAKEFADAALRDRDAEAAVAAANDPDVDRAGSRASGNDGAADLVAALRLLDRRHSALGREPDPRKRRQRAYSLLARNGFDPGVCLAATRTFLLDTDEAAAEQV